MTDPADEQTRAPLAAAPLTVAAVAHRLGIAPATLRTWDRRYGLGPSQHASGAHRRYSAGDVARLETMRRLVFEGVSAADAAKVALGSTPPPVPSRAGGRGLALPGADDVVRGLGRAALALDAETLEQTVLEQLEQHGVETTWSSVVVPLLVAVGERWAETGEGVEVEHLVSEAVASALRRYGRATGPVGDPRHVLLACAPDDQHVLPLHALSAGLAERGLGSRVLGAAVPPEALAAAVRRTGPSALFLWSQTRPTGDPVVLDALPTTRPATPVVVGGPGWPEELPHRAVRAQDLGAALDLLARAHGGQALASSG